VGPRTCLLISSLSTHGSLGGCGPHASPAETASQANVFEPPVWPAWTAPDVRPQSGRPFSARGRLHASRRRTRRRRAASPDIAFGLFARPRTGLTSFGRRQWNTRASRLRKTNGNRLSCGSSAMFAFSNMLHLFPDELSSLRGWRFAVARVPPSTIECLWFRHDESSLSVKPCMNRTLRGGRNGISDELRR
jgi:hypothetical protein